MIESIYFYFYVNEYTKLTMTFSTCRHSCFTIVKQSKSILWKEQESCYYSWNYIFSGYLFRDSSFVE